jgi:uncharacterized Tic20 family protein
MSSEFINLSVPECVGGWISRPPHFFGIGNYGGCVNIGQAARTFNFRAGKSPALIATGIAEMFSGMDDSPHQETPPPPVDSPNSRQWITILHISALAGFLLVGFGQILAPLIVWLIKKNEVPGLDAAGRNVLNFQISWSLWWALSWIFVGIFGCLIIPLVFPLIILVAWVIYGVLGAIKASDGVLYRFPMTIRFFN